MKKQKNMTSDFGIYFHIPFCIQICRYCDFNKSLRISFSRQDIENYHNSMLFELKTVLERQEELSQVRSVYFGGGTPSLYPFDKIKEILDFISVKKKFDKKIEITMEVDPKTIRKYSLLKLRDYGINRISLGVQSFQNDILKNLGRYHQCFDILKCFDDCRESGFGNISLDLIYGVPDQTQELWIGDLEYIHKLNPEHVSLYNLNIARGTTFYKKRKALNFPDDSAQMKFYKTACQLFKKQELRHYEISNFAKNGFKSRHNLDCWDGIPYIGIGAGASSFVSKVRWMNVKNIHKYISNVSHEKNVRSYWHKLTSLEEKIEFTMLKLRKKEGFSREEYLNRFGTMIESDFPHLFSTELNSLILKKKRIQLTSKGVNLSNEVFERLF